MRWDRVRTWLPPGVLRSLDSQGLGSAQSVSLSVQMWVASPFCSTTLHFNILERSICLLHLITSDWSGTSAELPHKVRCLFEARENPMTHPNIYDCNGPQAWECWLSLAEEFNPSVMGKEKRIPKTEFEILKFC
ncbi:hypothetical protein TNCV_4883981 [Trichonephila clavipes]|nr:hypothetical protein TNCV_4883981 [Trichonephila clavipes]